MSYPNLRELADEIAAGEDPGLYPLDTHAHKRERWEARLHVGLDRHLKALTAARDREEKLREVLEGLLSELSALVADSRGVDGYHRNGDIAPWDELLAGGRFECLASADRAERLLSDHLADRLFASHSPIVRAVDQLLEALDPVMQSGRITDELREAYDRYRALERGETP